MNIKQAEAATGISRQNIRFYEKEGLLAPGRNRLNAYREYSAADLRTLKLIKALRMLDMPLSEIRQVLAGALPLPEAAAAQQQRLEQQAEKLQAAIRFCGELQHGGQQAATLDVDAALARMEAAGGSGWFTRWAQDYQKAAAFAHNTQFVFYPDTPVTTPQEMAAALAAYAAENHLTLILPQESMLPHFTLDGVEYRACRRYLNMRGIPVAAVRCEVLHPEQFGPELPPRRKKWMLLLHYSWPVLAALAFALLVLWPRGLLFTWVGLLMLAVTGAAAVSNAVYSYYHLYNIDGKRGGDAPKPN